ncbi:MAG: aldo/keto reductase, partial [Acidimicrobiales bacterium]
YAGICREAGYTPAAVALAWVLRNQNVASAIVGATRPEQVTENMSALDVELSDELVAAIEAALEPASVNDPNLTVSPPSRS